MNLSISKWKYWLSYIKDVAVKDFTSEKNGEMHLYLSAGEFKLTTQNTIYSFGKKYTSFGNAFQKLEINSKPNLKEVLVLGWGMGSIANLLDENSTVQRILGVEYDKTLVEFYNQNKSKYSFDVGVMEADAFNFVRSSQEKFDLVCSDIFIDHISPAFVVSEEYIKHLDRLLNKNGFALISKLNRTSTDVQQNKILETALTNTIGTFSCIKTLGNSIYWWTK